MNSQIKYEKEFEQYEIFAINALKDLRKVSVESIRKFDSEEYNQIKLLQGYVFLNIYFDCYIKAIETYPQRAHLTGKELAKKIKDLNLFEKTEAKDGKILISENEMFLDTVQTRIETEAFHIMVGYNAPSELQTAQIDTHDLWVFAAIQFLHKAFSCFKDAIAKTSYT
jgi:hypothetical protein